MARGGCLLVLLSSFLTLSVPGQVLAAEGGEHGKSPVDYLFPAAPELAIWTLIVFLLLLFILTKFAWKPMLEALRKREQTIRGAVEEAKVARADTERMKNDFEAKLAEAHAQIPRMMDE